jgi:hypothetical protein
VHFSDDQEAGQLGGIEAEFLSIRIKLTPHCAG